MSRMRHHNKCRNKPATSAKRVVGIIKGWLSPMAVPSIPSLTYLDRPFGNSLPDVNLSLVTSLAHSLVELSLWNRSIVADAAAAACGEKER